MKNKLNLYRTMLVLLFSSCTLPTELLARRHYEEPRYREYDYGYQRYPRRGRRVVYYEDDEGRRGRSIGRGIFGGALAGTAVGGIAGGGRGAGYGALAGAGLGGLIGGLKGRRRKRVVYEEVPEEYGSYPAYEEGYE